MALIAAFPLAAVAQPSDHEAPTTPAQPLGAVRGTLLTGFPDMAALSISFHLPRLPLEIEGGFGLSLVSASVHLRAGPRFWFWSHRPPEGMGGTVGAGLLVGVRLAGFGAAETVWSGFAPNAVVALDGIVWMNPFIGLTAQLAGGFMYLGNSPEVRQGMGGAAVPVGGAVLLPDVRLSVGLAF